MIQPKPASCSLCRAYHSGSHGFVPDAPYNTKYKVALLLPGVSKDALISGDQLAGGSGWYLENKILAPIYKPDEVLVSAVIRCLPASELKDKKTVLNATSMCRQYDNSLREFNPSIAVVTYSSADVFKTPAFLRLVQSDIKRSYKLYKMGYRPIILMGLEATNVVLPWIHSLKAFRGHFVPLNNNLFSNAA